MKFVNETSFEAELIHGPAGPEEHGVVVIIKKTLPLSSSGPQSSFVWPVSLQNVKTDLAEFPFDHHFPTAKMDFMVCGFAMAPHGSPVRELRVSLSIGDFHYEQDIVGDRTWKKKLLSYSMTDPQPFEQMPLTLERAFGGKLNLESGDIPCLENPDGKGFLVKGFDPDGVSLPNIERPDKRIKMPFDLPAPTCMTPYPFSGKLRYDPLIVNGKLKPFHGEDSHYYFGQAHPDLMIDRLKPGVEVKLCGMHPERDFEWTVPGAKMDCQVEIDGKAHPLQITLDAICIFAHENSVGLKYRAATAFFLESRQDRTVFLREVSS